MGKKTLVKRAANAWPQHGQRERLDKAIDVLNEHEGLVETGAPVPEESATMPLCITHEQSEDLLNAITVAGLTEHQFCQMAGIKEISALAAERLNGAKARLQQIAQRGAQ